MAGLVGSGGVRLDTDGALGGKVVAECIGSGAAAAMRRPEAMAQARSGGKTALSTYGPFP
ncbi:hypothetical protein CS053_04105 [Rhodanobacter glycinis]|uniref:Uncharacterized protein n=1 Tax=Rhodanobacter glycinis TaxID=582702 RepID=A0A5B9DWP4_9GAMM|nr:hypothetical protein [Rhodanobacter glycinis]QEE23789.1 hypothetical protein CS053_04105 [Rhodanobacter glycinis]